jgi:hypothetical protein
MGYLGKLGERRYRARSVEPKWLGGLQKATVRRDDPEGVVRAGMDPRAGRRRCDMRGGAEDHQARFCWEGSAIFWTSVNQ